MAMNQRQTSAALCSALLLLVTGASAAVLGNLMVLPGVAGVITAGILVTAAGKSKVLKIISRAIYWMSLVFIVYTTGRNNLASITFCFLALECFFIGYKPSNHLTLAITALICTAHLGHLMMLGSVPYRFPLLIVFTIASLLFWLRTEAGLFPLLYLPKRMSKDQRREMRRFSPHPEDIPYLAGAGTALPLFGIMLITAVSLFLFTPRARLVRGKKKTAANSSIDRSNHTFPDQLQTDQSMGFSADAPLGGVAPNLDDEAVLMKVSVSPNLTGRLRLRGSAYDIYFEGRWLRTSNYWPVFDREDGATDGWTRLSKSFAPDDDAIRQNITPSNFISDIVFAMPSPGAVRAAGVELDDHGNAQFQKKSSRAGSYEVLSFIPDHTDTALANADLGRDNTRYTDLPEEFEKIRGLASTITGNAQSRLRICRAIQNHLRSNFIYARLAWPTPGVDPVEDFLFERKTGCCMHFASAMVVMLRTLKIPSRIVGGFLTNEVTAETFIARKKHAHAWVEVDFGSAGWVTFDPTPAAQEEGSAVAATQEDPSFFSGVSAFLNRVASYGEDDRAALLQRIPGLWILAAALALLLFFMYPRGAVQNKRKASVIDRKLRFYQRFIHVLSRRGLTPGKDETPVEFADRAAEAIPEETVWLITELFCDCCYGGVTPTKEAVRAAEKAISEI